MSRIIMRKRILFVCLLLLILVSPVLAHDWYDSTCCSNQHCHPITCESITEQGRVLVYKGMKFYDSMIKPSKDALCHVCIGDENGPYQRPICLYVQQGS